MLDKLKLPKTLAKRLDYLEWKEKAIAEGQADLDNGSVVSTAHIRQSLIKQRAAKNERAGI